MRLVVRRGCDVAGLLEMVQVQVNISHVTDVSLKKLGADGRRSGTGDPKHREPTDKIVY